MSSPDAPVTVVSTHSHRQEYKSMVGSQSVKLKVLRNVFMGFCGLLVLHVGLVCYLVMLHVLR